MLRVGVEVRETFCHLPHTKLILNSWGEVSMCCHQLTQLGRLGPDTDVMDLWNSPTAKAIRAACDRGELHANCASWNSCPFLVAERTPYPQEIYPDAAHPTYVEICLPDSHCNVGGERPGPDNPACLMCRRNFGVPEQPDLTEFLCQKVRPLMPRLRHLCVLGIAEPFWKDAVFRVFDLVDFARHRQHLTFTTNTNGTLLHERTARRFFAAAERSRLSWSLDAATAATHRKLRRLDTFDLVVANLRRWLRLRDDYGGPGRHRVSVYNNINMLNVGEMGAMVELAAAWGVDELVLLPTCDQSGVVLLGDLLLNDSNVGVFAAAAARAKEAAQALGVRLTYPTRFDVVPPPVFAAQNGPALVQIERADFPLRPDGAAVE